MNEALGGDLGGRAKVLLELHRPDDPVVLPTVWDVWSAQVAADAGFAALTVGSKPLAHSMGKTDHEGMQFEDVLDRVAQITAAVDIRCRSMLSRATASAPTG